MDIKKIIIGVSAVVLLLIVAAAIYTTTVYVEYVKDREAIFTKLEEFSKALDHENATTAPLNGEVRKERTATVVLDRNGKVITKYADDQYRLSSIQEMPYFLTRGFIYIEDRAFYKHHGINFKTIFIAAVRNVISLGNAGGGSTISQQLSKLLFTKQERNFKRKIYELFCTYELEKKFTKNDILKIYLNIIYMGHGNYGIANAANFYFGKSPAELTIAEAALLIGMNRSPERFSPIRNRENAEYIQKYVLNKFIEAGYLDKPQADMEYKRFWERFNARGVAGEQSIWKTETNNSGYLTEYVRQVLEREFDYDKITGGGLIVETTFDIERQRLAEKVMAKQLQSIRNRVKEAAAKQKTEYDEAALNKIEGSFTSIDYRTGEIYAIVGGSGYSFGNQLNRAISSYRQIGSSVKPFVYAKALDTGYIDDLAIQPFTKFKDEIVTYTVGGKKYRPKNYSAYHKYGDMVTLYDAVKRSLNTIAVKVMSHLDTKEVASLIASSAQLTEEQSKRVPDVLSLALGTAELSSYELATAYCIFPREGKTVIPVTIKKIYDRSGNIYFDYKRENNPYFNFLKPADAEEKQVIKPETAYELLQMMHSVFDKGGTGYWAAYINGLKKNAYGKSGTTQDYKDGWFAGVTNNEVTVCWVGFDNGEPMFLSGGTTAGTVWTDYNAQVSSDFSDTIEIPRNMKMVKIDTVTGLAAVKGCPPADVIDFYFRADGPLPEKCYVHSTDLPTIDEGDTN